MQYDRSDVLDQFKRAMTAAGVDFVGIPIDDGKIHRVDISGRRKGAKHGWYVVYTDGLPSGAFGDFKTGLEDTWSAKSVSKLTPEERRAMADNMAKARAAREAETAEANAVACIAAEAIWAAAGPADPAHPYLARKNVKGAGIRQLLKQVDYTVKDDERPNRRAAKGSLVVPLRDGAGKLWGVQLISDDGTKRFLKGGAKAGRYASIGKLTDTIIIAEGWATAASIHAATGLCVVVAFDRGNLEPVAVTIRGKYPKNRIIIAADNDRHTLEPIENPGLTSAVEAAKKIRARIAVPVFPTGDLTSTDWNDCHAIFGLEEVAAGIESAVDPATIEIASFRMPEPPEAPADDLGPDYPIGPEPDYSGPEQDPIDPPAAKEFEDISPDWNPIPLGHDHGQYFYLSAGSKEIFSLTAGGHSKLGLMQLAPLTYWEMTFPKKGGCDWDQAADTLIRACELRGPFDPDRIVGRGVHIDSGRVVLHLGDKLIVDGKVNGGKKPSMILPDSQSVFERLRKISLHPCRPLDDDSAHRLDEYLGLLPWKSSEMGAILAGAMVIAPICGALRWRPHVNLTGGRGTGKSWVHKEIVGRVLGPLAISVLGNTTEAGIRQKLNGDALPVLFDEAESQNDKARERIQLIMDMARAASSETDAAVLKGGQSGKVSLFRIRSMFFFTSIQSVATQSADQSRVISLVLDGPDPDRMTEDEKIERAEQFAYIERKFTELLTDDFGSRLFARTLLQVRAIRANAVTFAQAASEKTGSRRLADTLCAPLAGWWSLRSGDVLSLEEARRILDEQGWVFHAAHRAATTSDHDQALSHLFEQVLRLSASQELPIAELIMRASERGVSSRHNDETAANALLNYGIKVEPAQVRGFGSVLMAKGHAKLATLFEKTPWAGSWAGVLSQHPGCIEPPSVQRFGPMVKRALQFQISDVLAAD